VSNLVEAAEKRWTRSGLVNGAGILAGNGRADEPSRDILDKTLPTNVTGSLLGARQVVGRLSTLRGGKGADWPDGSG
jgi:NAD(P)-dependent dehydrogenase (short-subunit alcohol dehydrogenase family)